MIKRLLKALAPQDRFIHSVFTLLSGTTLALLIAYLAQPILTRLYTPSDFGLFDTFLAIVTILVPFASFRYEDALMLPDRDDEALHIVGLSTVLILVVTALIAGTLLVCGPLITTLFKAPELLVWLYWIPPVLIFMRFTKLGELWLTRRKYYRAISFGQVAQSGIMASLRIVLGSISSAVTAAGLFWGYLVGQASSMVWYTLTMIRKEKHLAGRAFDRSGIVAAVKRYRRFPMYSMPATLISALISRLPFLILLYFFDETTVGYFGRAFALFAVPLSLIGNAVSQVFFVEGMAAHRKSDLPLFLQKTLSYLILVGLFPTIAVMLTGPQVFGFLLGEQWNVAGQHLQYIAPWLFLATIASPLTRTFDILERQRLDLVISLGMFFLQTLALIAGGLSGSIWVCLLYVSIGGSIARLIQIGMILKIGGASAVSGLKKTLKFIILAVPFALILWLIDLTGYGGLTFAALIATGVGNLILGFRILNRTKKGRAQERN